jgi:hypothetical protein
MTKFTLPTGAQLYALEQMARRERAAAQAKLMLAAGRWLKETAKAVFFRPYAQARAKAPGRKVAFHG